VGVWKFDINDVEYSFSSIINHINDSEALIEKLKFLIEEKNDYIDELKTKIQELEAINEN
jgi:hypothetical protein